MAGSFNFGEWISARSVIGDALLEIGKTNEKLFVCTPDVGMNLKGFRQAFPERYIDVGIAEQNCVGVAAGLALAGNIPVIMGMLPFLSMRSCEQVRTDVFYNEDYIQYLYDFVSETSVYKDTSILESDVREKTDFYIKFLKPEDIIFGCGIILIKNSRIIGMFNLFRNEKSGDFNEKELYVLNLLKNHIANMLHNVMRLDRASITVNKSLNNFAKTYGLTSRESEILSLINKGLSNQEISDKVVISVSTVKKHIYNIYNKTGVSSRGQLISLFLE